MFYFKMLIPVISRLLRTLAERVTGHIRSTIQGGAVALGIFEVMELSGCNLDLLHEAMISVIAGLPSLVGTDASKAAPTLLQVAKETIQQGRKSEAVMSDAIAKQEEWKDK